MTGRRTPSPRMFVEPDPMADAVFTDTLGIAGELGTVMEALSGFDQSSVKGILFRKPPGGLGRFEWIEEVSPPIDMSTIMGSLKSRFGGGEYRLQIFAGGKTRKVIEFPIMSEPRAPTEPAGGLGGSNLIVHMMNMQAESRREMMDQQRFAMEQQAKRDADLARQRSEDRQQLMATLGIVIPVVAPLMFGGREKLTDLLAIMQATKPEGGGLKETLEVLASAKTLLGDGDKGTSFNPDDLVGSIGRLAGPMLGAAGRAFGSGRGAAAGPTEEPAQIGDGQLHLPPPDAAPAMNFTLPPSAPALPLLTMIRPHVLYFFNAHLDPGLAAEAIADIMQRENVAPEAVNGLVSTFALSADWKADLAAQGIDLRGDDGGQWADEFLSQLIDIWNQPDQHGHNSAGGGGGLADLAADADPGAPGLALNGHSPPGATAHQ